MKLLNLILLLLLISTGVAGQTTSSPEDVFTLTEQVKGQTIRLAREKEQYHTLDFYLLATLNNDPDKLPKEVEFTLISVVKARRLNSDLYVVFVADGKEFHFGSDRSAIKRPVPGRTWIGEKMVFKIPMEDYQKLAAAQKLAIKMGGVEFEFDEKAKAEVRSFAKPMKIPRN